MEAAQSLIERVSGLADDLGDLLSTVQYNGGQKHVALGLASLNLALEHFDSIGMLTASGRSGAASTLIRPLIEAARRGAWLALVATVERARSFAEGRKRVDPGKMISALAAIPEIDATAFATPHDPDDVLHGLTHGGYNQLSHRLRDGHMSGQYKPEFVDGMVRLALRPAIWSAVVFAQITGIPNPRAAVGRLIKDWHPAI